MEDGFYFFSMPLMAGGTLADHLVSIGENPKEAVRLMIGVVEAVHEAHQRGLLHRDLKPENLFLDDHGQLQIADFGLVCEIERQPQLTISGQIMGNPPYLAPELAGDGGCPSIGTDIYSLGVILYQLLGGIPVFDGPLVPSSLKQLREKNPKPRGEARPEIDQDLTAIVMRCLEKDPRKRYSSAVALRNDLIAWLEGRL